MILKIFNAPSWGNFIYKQIPASIVCCALCCGYVEAKTSKLEVTHLHQKAKVKPEKPNKEDKRIVIHNCSKNDSKVDMLSCALYHEARSEGLLGMWLVGNVILNRKGHDKYPSTVKRVIYQNKQFSYLSRKSVKVYDKHSWQQAQAVSRVLLNPNMRPLQVKFCQIGFSQTTPCKMNQDALYYFKTGTEPSWVNKQNGFVKVIKYKNHVFYEEKR